MDNLLQFYSFTATAITADENSSTKTVRGGTWHNRMWLNVIVRSGAVGSSTGTVAIKLQGTTYGGSSWVDVTPTKTVDLTTTATAAVQTFSLPVESKYEDYRINIDGTGTSWTISLTASLDLTPIEG